jgi:hypothetical protein
MNDAILAEQLRKTGNLLDLLNDDDWVRNADEEDFVEAGLGLQPYVDLIQRASPEALRRQRWYVRVLSILLPELKQWLESWQLGRSFEAVYMEAQRRLYKHLEQLTSEQQDWIEALLTEAEQAVPDEQKVIRAQATTWLAQLFTEEDWNAIAQAASQAIAHDIQHLAREATKQTVVHQ